VLAGAAFAASSFFSSATLTVVPKQETASVDTLIESSSMPAAGELPHVLVTATSTGTQVLPSTGTQEVQRKASGQIVVYNNYSSATQRLIKNTRFEASDGRIYRINTSVDVPGRHTEDGKTVPGSVTVTVYADVAGEEYDLLLSGLKGDFTIPGFKGTSRYDAFYARAKTDIVGGFVGVQRVTDQTVFDTAVAEGKTQLADSIWSDIQNSLSNDVVAFKSLYGVEYTVDSKDNPSGDGVLLSITGIGKAVVYSKLAFSKAVASTTLSDYSGDNVVIQSMGDLEISPRVAADTEVWDSDPLTVEVRGNVRFVWQFDQAAVKKDLAGRSKDDTNSILRKYAAIQQAQVVVKPSWLRNYPSDQRKIDVQIKLD